MKRAPDPASRRLGAWSPAVAPILLTEASDGVVPADPGARILFVIIGVVILGLYFLLRATRRRSEDAYWERRQREQDRRNADPDMRSDG